MRKFTALVVTLAMIAAGDALASEIYKWTDADGNVNYGDRPAGDEVERVAIVSNRTSSSAVQAGIEARHERESAREEARNAALEAEKEAEELRAEAKDRADKCETYRQQLQKLVTSRRLYRLDENGERVYLDDGQSQAARENVQERVQEYCSS